MNHVPKLVEEVFTQQRLDEADTAGNPDILAGLLLCRVITSTTSSLISVELFHSAFSKVVETTNLGVSFM
jgi:hypothetical protein